MSYRHGGGPPPLAGVGVGLDQHHPGLPHLRSCHPAGPPPTAALVGGSATTSTNDGGSRPPAVNGHYEALRERLDPDASRLAARIDAGLACPQAASAGSQPL